jgi:hypothetical protein
MKSNLRFLLIVAVIVLVASPGWSVRGQRTPAPVVTWEHSIFVSPNGDNSTRLGQLGAQGWELAAVRSEEKPLGNFRQTEVTYYLRRAKSAAR